MREASELFAAAKRGDVDLLRAELGRGFDPNTACEHTGTNALLSACESDQLDAVLLLLSSGASPDARHRDGYNCWDTTRSRAVREALLRGGFSLILDERTEGRGLLGRRLLAPRAAMSDAWECALEGATLFLEVLRADFPPSSGEARIRVTGVDPPIVLGPEPGTHATVAVGAGAVRVTLTLSEFVGELRLRTWADEVISAHASAREFWLPCWDL